MLRDRLLHIVGWGWWLVSMAWLVRFVAGVADGYFYALALVLAVTASMLSAVAMGTGWVDNN